MPTPTTRNFETAGRPKKKFRSLKFFLGLGFVVLAVLFLSKVFLLSQSVMRDTGLTPRAVGKLLFDSGVPLAASDNRTNILVLGIGGEGHTGNDLTDTMIVLSAPTGARSMSMVSLPRDLWSETLQDKINSAFHYGEEKKPGGGPALAKAIVHEETGLPIHYYILIDFSGFQDIIDLVGGIDVAVPVAFTDPQYPILGKEADPCGGDPAYSCRYTEVHFDAGTQHMDGATSLMYVRSRHAEGDEGTDFARGRRQQEVLSALQEKMAKPEFWLDMRRVRSALSVLKRTMKTDMNFGELATIGKETRSIPKENLRSFSIESELVTAPKWKYGGRYVLVPKGTADGLHSFIRSKLGE